MYILYILNFNYYNGKLSIVCVDIKFTVTVFLPDAVVSDRVPASSEEELGAWPDKPRLWRPRPLLLLPKNAKTNVHEARNITSMTSTIQNRYYSYEDEILNHQMKSISLSHIKATVFHWQNCGFFIFYLVTLLILLKAESNCQFNHCFIICIRWDIQHRGETLCSCQQGFKRRRISIVYIFSCVQDHWLWLEKRKKVDIKVWKTHKFPFYILIM